MTCIDMYTLMSVYRHGTHDILELAVIARPIETESVLTKHRTIAELLRNQPGAWEVQTKMVNSSDADRASCGLWVILSELNLTNK